MTLLNTFARATLVPQPTPLHRLNRMSDHLGIDLWIKRDDLAGPSFGGNKARQLEFYLGAAQAQGADTILITGAVQSNFVRTAAACANALGMRAVVQLEDRVADMDDQYRHSGNVLLNQILGAEIITYPEGEDEAGADRALNDHADALRAKGRRPYVIHLGETHPPLGALGYMRAAEEVLAQDAGFDVMVVASGSGATHSGLLAGLRACGSPAQVIGSCVRRAADLQGPRIARLLGRIAQLVPDATPATQTDITVWDGALAPGYGQIGPPAKSAIESMARMEGLMLDPVYTAKVFAAVPALIADGTIAKGARVCFWHTGGLASFFAYETEIRAKLGLAPPE